MAINPIETNWGCAQKMLKIVNDSSTLEKDASEMVKQGFEMSPDFELVYLNNDQSKLLKTWMSDGTTQDKLMGYKKLFSYPYPHVLFDIGNYVYFDYYDVGIDNKDLWSCWLILSLDYQNYYDVNGRVYLCNEMLKWKTKDGLLIEYPTYVADSMKYTTLNLGTQGVTEPDCDIIASIQRNDNTDTVNVNQRFLFSGRAYTVVQKNIEVSKKVITLYLNKDALQPNDDVENNIAWNGIEVIEPIQPSTNGNILLPEINGIILGDTKTFSIYEYTNGVKTTATFTITVSGLDSSYYTLDLIDLNNFSITNLKSNKNKPLVVTMVNKDTSVEITKELWLLGVF